MHLNPKTSPQQKKPENAPDTTPFIPKGALIHTKKHYPKTSHSKTPMTGIRSQPPKTPRSDPNPARVNLRKIKRIFNSEGVIVKVESP
jgi:hypothetical protein